ncbi:hypothetical protein [Actinomadura montaniterrae]|uniref:Uncharacterized protein n=1 Tax=Actinomadura montaniterrae TaxID=1803903 RepID=A0A6L3VK99_9ACTN|nr:hypothetical protein [Actinomadura montaniterrae]KAB2357187.1 hypothetical protein F9B16_48445 [Actinomadura montaniterrae]
MTDQAPAREAAALRAGWAIRGKPPGSYDEYRVTGCGGPDFSSADYAHILRHFALGTPSPGRSGPAALPWITISEVRGGDDGTRIGVALEDWTGEADGAGRPIAETRYLCVPYEALRAVPVSYAGLYEALSALTPPFPSDGLDLRVPPLDPAAAAEALQRFGTQRVAAAASLLLDGPVTITGAPDLAVLDRLAFLDAVAALLPYGWRTRFSAATWDQSGNRNVSLAFARQVRERTAELDWRAPRLPERDTPGRAYAEMLADLFGERGRTAAEVVAHLAEATAPLADADAGAVVRVLGGLDWPATVLQAVERGTYDPADVRDLLAAGRHRELGDAGARKMLYALIRERAPEDVPLLRERWAEVAGTTVTPFRELCGAVRALVWSGEDVPSGARAALALPYFQLAHDLGRADELLAAVVTAPKRDVDEVGAEAAALVVLEAIGPAAVVPAGPRWPQTLGELGRSPRVVCALMTAVGRGEPAPLQAWYECLTHHLPESLLGLFRNLMFSPLTPVHGDQFAALARHDPACVGDVLALAAEARRLPLVLDGLADWLTSLDRIPAGDALVLKGRLARAAAPDPASLGMLDGLLLWLAAPPHHVTGTATADHPAYWEGFRSVWARPMPQGRADRRRETLTAWLRAGGWASGGGAGPVLMLARELMAGPHDEARPVAKAMLAARANVPALGAVAEYQVCRHEAEQLFPELAKDPFMTVLTNLPQNATAGHIATLCAQEMARGVPAAQIADTLLNGLPNITAGTVVELIGEVRFALTELEDPDAANRALDLARAIARYPGVGPGLRTQAAAVALAEIAFWHRVIEITAADQDGELLISEETRDGLKRSADRAQSLLKASKPARWGRGGGGRS